MIPPDQEIYDVERRIAERRHRVEAVARQTGQAAFKALTSPWALAGAAVLGFLAASGLQRRHHHASHARWQKTNASTTAKVGGLTSIAMAAASWIIKAQFGSPAALAKFVMSKVKKESPQPVRASSRSDRAVATTRR
jgi:hypothetical protein